MKKALSVLLVVFMLVTGLLINTSAADVVYHSFEECAANAGAAILYDENNRTVLYEKNADEKIAPASITKLVTAMVALKYASANTVFTVGSEQNLVHMYSSICFIEKGEKLTLQHLIYGMLIPSGNDAAYTIAVNIARIASGDPSMSDRSAVSYFCDLMNDYAKGLGTENTNFINPDGWDETEHYSSARDLLLITNKALKFKTIVDTVGMASVSVTVKSGQNHYWTNSNYMLHRYSQYYYQYATGVKTGTTDNAGYCLSARAEKDGKGYIAIVLKCPTERDRFSSAALLLDLALRGRPKGDIDGDYAVTSIDARLVLRLSIDIGTPTEEAVEFGDMDGDGVISTSDARSILRKAIGLE